MDESKYQEDKGPERYLAYLGRIRNLAAAGSRYLAFTSDVGEAVRPVVPPAIVNASYAISFAYVGFDVAMHTAREIDHGGNGTRTVVERSLFQGLASLLLPAVTIHTVVGLAQKQLVKRMFLLSQDT